MTPTQKRLKRIAESEADMTELGLPCEATQFLLAALTEALGALKKIAGPHSNAGAACQVNASEALAKIDRLAKGETP